MFDTHVTRYTTEYVDRNITVREYRAPTDESIKILNEMLDKTLSNLTKSFSTTNNTLQVTGAVWEEHLRQERVFMCKFVLNGKEHLMKIDIPTWKFDSVDSIVQELYEKICSKLTVELMQPLLKEMQNAGGDWFMEEIYK